MNSRTILSTENLSISIAKKSICKNLSFTIKQGECWAILGQNGTGKTTLLHTLSGLLSPDEGQIILNGTPISQLSSKSIAQQCGLLLQDYQDIFPASVLDAVLIGRHPHLSAWQWESDKDHAIALNALRQVSLESIAQRDVQTLSGGERRRVAIAAILAQQPELYLLDEPANHLDIKHQYQVLKLFSDKTAIMVLHDVNLAARFCSHVLFMYGNNKIEYGSVGEMLQEDKLSELYGHPIHQVDADRMLFMPS